MNKHITVFFAAMLLSVSAMASPKIDPYSMYTTSLIMEFPTRADAQSSSTGIDKVVGVYCTGKQAANYEVRILDEKLKALVSCGSTSFTFEKYYNMQPSGSERRVSVIYIRLPYAEMVESTTYYIKPSIDLFCEAYPKAEIRIDYDATNQHFLYGCDGT